MIGFMHFYGGLGPGVLEVRTVVQNSDCRQGLPVDCQGPPVSAF